MWNDLSGTTTVCALAGSGNALNLTLHQLGHRRVKSEVFSAEVSLGTLTRPLGSNPGYRGNHKIHGPTLEHMCRDWASSGALACAVEKHTQNTPVMTASSSAHLGQQGTLTASSEDRE